MNCFFRPVVVRCRSEFVLMFVALISICSFTLTASAQNKLVAVSGIDEQSEVAWQMAKKIWNWAELGYQEKKSAALLADYLKTNGFEIKTEVAEIPTAFTATFGEGKPVVGILGEYDALPGLSQSNSSAREQRLESNNGHGCGHHVFGVASATAAVAVAKQIKAGHLKGTVQFYGCPAEEGGSGKVFLVRAGLFNDCDAVLHWHPSDKNAAGTRSSLARIAVRFRFHGKSAHAAGAPEQGRSALDAVELTNHATQLLREHTPEGTRIHHVITAGGNAPNVVPDFAEVYYYVRHPKSAVVSDLYRRLVLCAKAGALATETKLDVKHEGGIVEILPNPTLADVVLKNLRELNNLKYSEEEMKFALRIQATMSNPKPINSIQTVIERRNYVGKGSTDVGDVSWVVPTVGFNTACWVPGTPGHSWQAVACGGNTMAQKGMTLAGKVLVATAWDLMMSPELLKSAKNDLEKGRGKNGYQPLMPKNMNPPLNYRNPPKAN